MTTFNEVKNRKGMKERNKLQIIIKSEKKAQGTGKKWENTHTHTHPQPHNEKTQIVANDRKTIKWN